MSKVADNLGFAVPQAGADGRVARSDAMSALLAENWLLVSLRGILGLFFGSVVFLLPGVTIASLVLLFAAYMLADGIVAIVSALRAVQRQERWGWFILEGLVNIAAGVFALLMPAVTVVAFVLLIAAWAIVSGVFMQIAAFRLKPAHGRWLLGLGGLLSVIWGLLLLLAPIPGALVLTYWLGAYALIFGASLVGVALPQRRIRGASDSAAPLTA